jgi:hypothetical protein
VKKISDDSAVTSFDALYSLLTSAPLSEVLVNLRNHVFACDDDFSFQTPEGLCKINFFDLMFLSKFIDVGGCISNVPDLNIVQIKPDYKPVTTQESIRIVEEVAGVTILKSFSFLCLLDYALVE